MRINIYYENLLEHAIDSRLDLGVFARRDLKLSFRFKCKKLEVASSGHKGYNERKEYETHRLT